MSRGYVEDYSDKVYSDENAGSGNYLEIWDGDINDGIPNLALGNDGSITATGDVNFSGDFTLTGDFICTSPTTFRNILSTPITLSYAATVNTDASLADKFIVTGITGSFTLANVTNSTDFQEIVWRFQFTASGAKTLTLGSNFRTQGVGTPTISTTNNTTDYLKARYNSAVGKWDVIEFVKGYA